jgi:non-ribosomal peptide synthetase component F
MTNVLEQQWSRNDTSDESEDTIASRFERQVAAVPDKLAIVTDDISLTYRALDLKASRIAAGLASLPSQRDQPIVLCERAKFILAQHAISRSAAPSI